MLSKQSQRTHYWFIDILGMILFFGVFYALWIGSHALFTPDEGRYSEVAREMVTSGDYVTPRLDGVAFLDKPILYYWLQASAIHLFGLKEWALRFWPAFMGVLGSLVTYVNGRILFNRRTGILSAIALATAPLYYGAAHYANLDLEVAVLIGNSLLCFIAGMQTASSALKKYLLLAAYVFAGLAALTKGLIGIAFPGLIIGAWIVILNRWHTLITMRLLSGMLIFLLITAPWYILVQRANPEFLHFFFVTQQVSRFLTMQDFNDKAAIWFYIPVVLAGFFPWSIFLIQAISQKIRFIWKDKQQHAVELFLVIWFFTVFIFFSIPHSKTVGYILPIFPVSALLVGHYLSTLWDQASAIGIKVAVILFTVLCGVIGIGFIIAPFFLGTVDLPVHFFPYLRYMAIAILGSGITSFVVLQRKTLAPLVICLALSITVLLLIFSAGAESINEKSVKPLAVQLKPYLQQDDEVIAYYKYYQDLPIYLERRITIVADWHAADIPKRDNWLRELWYGMVFQDTKDWLIEDNTFWQRWNSGKRLYVITDENNFHNLEKKTTVYRMGEKNNIVLLTNLPNADLAKNPDFINDKSDNRQRG